MAYKNIVCKDTKEFAKTYSEYLLTNHWKALRCQVAKRENHICEMCGKKVKSGYHIHHKTYANIGKEKLSDLMFLCDECHTEIHISLRAKINNIGKRKEEKKTCNNCYYSQLMVYKGKKDRVVLWCNKKYKESDYCLCSNYKRGEYKEATKIKRQRYKKTIDK